MVVAIIYYLDGKKKPLPVSDGSKTRYLLYSTQTLLQTATPLLVMGIEVAVVVMGYRRRSRWQLYTWRQYLGVTLLCLGIALCTAHDNVWPLFRENFKNNNNMTIHTVMAMVLVLVAMTLQGGVLVFTETWLVVDQTVFVWEFIYQTQLVRFIVTGMALLVSSSSSSQVLTLCRDGGWRWMTVLAVVAMLQQVLLLSTALPKLGAVTCSFLPVVNRVMEPWVVDAVLRVVVVVASQQQQSWWDVWQGLGMVCFVGAMALLCRVGRTSKRHHSYGPS